MYAEDRLDTAEAYARIINSQEDCHHKGYNELRNKILTQFLEDPSYFDSEEGSEQITIIGKLLRVF